MQWLNYHHLLYFWTVVRQGGIAKAADELRLSPSTISAQLRSLQDMLGQELFERQGRKLALTDAGRIVYRYADEIFLLGKDLLSAVSHQPVRRPLRFQVGVAEVIPKLVAKKLLEPALDLSPPVHLVCREGSSERMLAELSIHNLDVVLTDMPIGSLAKVRGYNHLLGESDILIFGAAPLARKHRGPFPASLSGAPFLLPMPGTVLRQSLDGWFEDQGIEPRIVGEFEDSALMKVFGQLGAGMFAAPAIIRNEVTRQYHVREIGVVKGCREQFYAISVERKLKHPAVVAIAEAAKKKLFG